MHMCTVEGLVGLVGCFSVIKMGVCKKQFEIWPGFINCGLSPPFAASEFECICLGNEGVGSVEDLIVVKQGLRDGFNVEGVFDLFKNVFNGRVNVVRCVHPLSIQFEILGGEEAISIK